MFHQQASDFLAFVSLVLFISMLYAVLA